MKNNYKFFEWDLCNFYPCHEIKGGQKLNCLFCFCPLKRTSECVNNDDCENCLYPHKLENYNEIIKKLKNLYSDKRRKVIKIGSKK